MTNSVFIIAELGSTWEQHLDTALRMIRAAASAGANAVKTQWTSNPVRMAARRNAPELAEQYRVLAWPAEWHAVLAEECRATGVEYMNTVYLPEDIAVIAPHVQRFKVSSFEAHDWELIRVITLVGKPIIVSAGMQDEGAAPIPMDCLLYTSPSPRD